MTTDTPTLEAARETMAALWAAMRDTFDPGAFELVRTFTNLETYTQICAGEMWVRAELAQEAAAYLPALVKEARALLTG